ncbi:MAG: hypothetical protein ACHQX1_03220 [Candidatus Micrarchaeales archaeon]
MLKLIVEILLMVVLVFLVLYMLNPNMTLGIINSIYPILTPAPTCTVLVPSENVVNKFINFSDERTSYILSNKSDSVVYIYGNSDIITLKSASGVKLYVVIDGNFNMITIENSLAYLIVRGDHNAINLMNTTVSCKNFLGSGTQLYSSVNASG